MKLLLVLAIVLSSSFLACDGAPILRGAGVLIPNQYVVVFRPNSLESQRSSHLQQVRQWIAGQADDALLHTYEMPQFSGYSIRAGSSVLNRITGSPIVDYVEQDAVVRTNACQVETNATWGIDRIDSHPLKLNKQYNYSDSSAGLGVTAYVIDTGIQISHPEFGGRAFWGATFPSSASSDDCNGHGTHVAGTIGSLSYGVAKKVTLVAVKVLGCDGSGSISDVIAGVNWVTNTTTSAGTTSRSVANMSLGGSSSSSLSQAVSSAISAGIIFAVAAGNDNTDACRQSPANVGNALTVGASTSSDARASFSNWGNCVDLFGPGQDILSTWIGSSTRTLSGTSMATPHVTGAAAVLRSANPSATASTVKSQATSSVININCSSLRCRLASTTRSLMYSSC